MKTFIIHTLGCKVNQYESRQIQQVLETFGLTDAEASCPADLIVVNSCCVTAAASAKSRNILGRLMDRNPDASVILTGCLAVADNEELKILSGKTINVIPDKNKLPDTLSRILASASTQNGNKTSKPLNSDKIKYKNLLQHQQTPGNLPILSCYAGHCRAFLKVQDGCDAFCSYCIIPQLRPLVCQKPVKTVLQEAQNLIRSGHKEIVLSGIFLGAYGQSTARRKYWNPENRNALADLLEQLTAINGLQRIRLSSLEPADVTDRLLEVFAQNPAIMPHLHLPLQSASPIILRKMCRQYTLDDYLQVIDKVKTALDRPAITTDIIVGFPGETNEDFHQTLHIAEKIGFSKIHVFPFSPRKNTPAAKMPGRINPQIARSRSDQLQNLDKQLQEKFRRQFIGQKVNVLVEALRPPKGLCERYFMVDLSGLPQAARLRRGDVAETVLTA
jgi:threonylcarbamoyladenosine tRNA methylthiotransferase MtaB